MWRRGIAVWPDRASRHRPASGQHLRANFDKAGHVSETQELSQRSIARRSSRSLREALGVLSDRLAECFEAKKVLIRYGVPLR